MQSRNGVWRADGRGNKPNAGRRSLGIRDFKEAQKLVHKLDEKMAERLGLIRFARRDEDVNFKLTIDDGIRIYEDHIRRPVIAGGIKETTRKRYKRAIPNLEGFVKINPIQYWEQFDADFLISFIEELEKSYKPSSIVTIVTTTKTIHRHLIEDKYLDQRCAFRFLITRAKESTKYCPLEDEMREILACLNTATGCQWLYDATAVLSHSGLRLR